MRNLASALFLTERDAEFDDNAPKIKGRIETTLPKAKEVRPLVERCVTIARRSLQHSRAAEEYATDAERGTDQWKSWRTSEQWQKWNAAIAPVVAARRRALRLLGDKQAVQILFDDIAPRFEDRDGGYTRILKLAQPRLGDAGARALLEFVGVNDRTVVESEKPSFATEDEDGQDSAASDEAEEASNDEDGVAADGDSTEEAKQDSTDEAKEEKQ